ncbi:MAG TPA: enoyl-CoA hydratase-related protein [Candidatus Competibacteraceae bacterium]|nr:enoyl-CoA hydratase-related protein [Candidatus Competibacteraceae bacterium]
MSYENILLEQIEPGIWRLTLNRPKALNALNAATVAELHDAVLRVAAAAEARVLLLTGAGDKAFVAGADIKEMQDYTALQAQEWAKRTMAAFRALETLPIPTIAVVNGYALGGGNELAMSCDWILAADRAVFGQPEVNLGVTPGFGGTQRLTRLVGRAMALELLVTGRQIKADEAKSLGLVNHVYPGAELMDRALEMARAIAAKGPLAVRLCKEAVQRGQDLDLENACQLEAQVFGLCFSTEDQKEGMKAFIEKRSPQFRNR